jgi:4-amino-4-deoxy-L-arabinose transferase-like glycosyltransferase
MASPLVSARYPALGLALFILVTRLPAIIHPRAIDDEQVYSVVAGEMLHGGKPYLDAVERKPPLLFALYSGIFALAGERNWPALHLTAALWTLATMGCVYLIARRLFDRATGLWAAFLYGLYLAWADYRNLALNGELLMNLPVAMAYALALGPGRSRWRVELFLAGALVAIAFLLKQPSGIAALPLGLYLLRRDYRQSRGLDHWHSLAQAALLTMGFVAVFAGAGALLFHEGILKEAIYWTVLNQGIPPGVGTRMILANAPLALTYFLASSMPLLVGAGLSLVDGRRRQGCWSAHRADFAALEMLLAVSLLGVAVNGQFLFHYFLQLVLPLALLAAPMFAMLARGERRWAVPAVPRRVVLGWLGLTAVAFLTIDMVGLVRNRSETESGRFVRAHSRPDERIFVWGQGDRQTGIYLDAERRPATRYISTYPLTGHVFSLSDAAYDASKRIVPGAWQHLAEDFERHPPRYIIDTDATRPRPWYPLARYPFLRDYLARSYREALRARDGIVYERLPDQ